MTELSCSLKACEMPEDDFVYLAEDVDALLEDKDKLITGLEDEIRFMRHVLSKYIEGKS